MQGGTENQFGGGRVLFAALLVLLVWAPLPLGSNRPWSAALLAGSAVALLGCWLIGRAWSPGPTPPALIGARGPLVLAIASCLYVLAQAVPVPDVLLARLSPTVAGLAEQAAAAGAAVDGALSIDRQATLEAFLGRCGQAALFACTLALVTTRERLAVLLAAVLLAGFGNALYGLVAHFTSDWSGLWNPAGDRRLVTGTYVNRNHFAGLMELAIPVGLGLVAARIGGRLSWRRPRDLVRGLLDVPLSGSGRVAFYLVVMCAALLMSASRAGAGALLAGVGGAAALAATRGGGRELRLLPLFACVLAVAAAWFGLQELAQRLDADGLASNRADLREVAYAMIAESPWFGYGAGTFRWIFPAYRDEAVAAGFYEHAHNDFLEIWIEQGLVGLVLWLALVAWVYARMLGALARRRDPLVRGALFAVLAATLALLVHGLVDFNLQIPANAALFHVLLATGLAAARIQGRPRRRREATGPLGVVTGRRHVAGDGRGAR